MGGYAASLDVMEKRNIRWLFRGLKSKLFGISDLIAIPSENFPAHTVLRTEDKLRADAFPL
jgi:hypothetical protein